MAELVYESNKYKYIAACIKYKNQIRKKYNESLLVSDQERKEGLEQRLKYYLRYFDGDTLECIFAFDSENKECWDFEHLVSLILDGTKTEEHTVGCILHLVELNNLSEKEFKQYQKLRIGADE